MFLNFLNFSKTLSTILLFYIDTKDLLCTKCTAYLEFFRFINKGEHRMKIDVPLNILRYLNVGVRF
nr:hypothetical protein [Borreliella burgdorferi]